MAIKLSIELPIKPHLKKYLLKKLNCDSDVIEITFNDVLGFGMYVTESLLKKKKYHYFRNDEAIQSFCDDIGNDSIVTLGLKDYHYQDAGIGLSPEKIYYINKFVEKAFRNELFTSINTQIRFYPYVVITVAIDDFLSLYEITECEIARGTIYKLYHRHKNTYSYVK